MTRWKSTDVWEQMGSIKHLFAEPRGTGPRFKQLLAKYREACVPRHGNGGGNGQPAGALLFAVRGCVVQVGGCCRHFARTDTWLADVKVCRGKVSEGLDFSDHNARAVRRVWWWWWWWWWCSSLPFRHPFPPSRCACCWPVRTAGSAGQHSVSSVQGLEGQPEEAVPDRQVPRHHAAATATKTNQPPHRRQCMVGVAQYAGSGSYTARRLEVGALAHHVTVIQVSPTSVSCVEPSSRALHPPSP